MEFKAGDRVHVTRLNGNKVDFYATLKNTRTTGVFCLIDCTYYRYESVQVYTPKSFVFGPDKTDYYTLATDEEDTEEPVIQRINDTVNHPSHYNFGDIEVVDFIEQVTKHYNSDVAYHIGNAIKYISRAPHKNGKEDIAKAKWYIERAFDKWED
ncbi:DUF3310 domain-containing protein [Mammaliicoccus sciuri]|uniref:DUF3310 domain-containing protein n=1 Tax=Mammaliicoccus sciuri TaxID=1296 RepID=UPI002887E578|nr:DUF3310 domain-containing protein [Mammaliicoccus sciuri]MDT0703934.1 DUF3310 domain-containing protein [Mammaliicoccus sciuri]